MRPVNRYGDTNNTDRFANYRNAKPWPRDV